MDQESEMCFPAFDYVEEKSHQEKSWKIIKNDSRKNKIKNTQK